MQTENVTQRSALTAALLALCPKGAQSANRKKLKKQAISVSGAVVGFACPVKEIEVVVCSKGEADDVITPHHYSKKVTKNSFLSFLVKYKGETQGALQLGYGIRPKIKPGMASGEVREFDRMWLSDIMPKFSETVVISLLHCYLKARHPEIKTLISYADTSAGMTGTIYRAANYRLLAELKADFYVLATGERVHPVTMWHRHKTRKWSFLTEQYPGISKAQGKQLKFVFEL